MDQSELTGIYCTHPQNFAWFLGAGTSSAAGLPTANDILWDMKRHYYCHEENQEILQQDIENDAIRTRIQIYMESKGFPSQWEDNEYSTYFKKIFGNDKKRQRIYLRKILSEEQVSLSVGNRVMGALMVGGHIRTVFTTNFDSVVEKAVAEMGGQSLATYHLEGSTSANNALNNEEYPFYCKLHGDFRYESLRNLPEELKEQNQELSKCLINASNRFGLIVIGYSGRDTSVMSLFRNALDSNNPFPHGLFWTGIDDSPIYPEVKELLELAQSKNVQAEYVKIETFDTLMLRLWRNIEDKSPDMDAKVRKTKTTSVNIPLPRLGNAHPITRMNALPVLSFPQQCLKLSFRSPKTWLDLREKQKQLPGKLVFTITDSVWCWGTKEHIKQVFSSDLLSLESVNIPPNLSATTSLQIRSFFKDALCRALVLNKPLLYRAMRYKTFLIADSSADNKNKLDPLAKITGKISGCVPNLLVPVDNQYPKAEPVRWAEAVQVSLDVKNGNLWVLLNPDIWIWPPRARKISADFIENRRKNRFNKKFNDLIGAWIQIILGTNERNAKVTVSAFAQGSEAENPSFCLTTRTAFSKRLTS